MIRTEAHPGQFFKWERIIAEIFSSADSAGSIHRLGTCTLGKQVPTGSTEDESSDSRHFQNARPV